MSFKNWIAADVEETNCLILDKILTIYNEDLIFKETQEVYRKMKKVCILELK